MIILGGIILILAIGFMAGVLALWFVSEWQEYRRNGE